jgi:hypothetical protein
MAFGLQPAQVPNPPSLTPAYVEPRASAMVHDLANGADTAVVDQLDPLTRTAVTADELRRLWGNFEDAYGTFVSQGPAGVSALGPVDVSVRWARATSTIVVAFDWNGQVDGFEILRPDGPSQASDLRPLPLAPAASQVAAAVCRELAAQDLALGHPPV